MSEDYAKLLEQNSTLEDIIMLMLGLKDEGGNSDEGSFGSDFNINFEEGSLSHPEDSNSADLEAEREKHRIEFYQALPGKYLLIPIRNNVSEQNENKSDEPVTVEPITQKHPLGEGEDLIAFTSFENFKSRLRSGSYIICDIATILKFVLQGGFKSLVINPGIYWIAIPSEDISRFFKIDNE